MSSTREEIVPKVSESNRRDKDKKKVVEVPKYDVPRVRHDVPDSTPRPTIFDELGDRVTPHGES